MVSEVSGHSDVPLLVWVSGEAEHDGRERSKLLVAERKEKKPEDSALSSGSH